VNNILIYQLLLFLTSFAGFLYGAVLYFRKHVALYNQIVVFGLGCIMLARLFRLLYYILCQEVPVGFNVSMLGIFGGFFFLFSASYGQMDGLVDGKQKELQKYRVQALLAPAVIAAIWVVDVLSTESTWPQMLLMALRLLPIALCSYYNLKQYIIPDVEFGILDAIRSYNLTALILCLFSALELFFERISVSGPLYGCEILISFLYLFLIPILRKGSKRWTI